MSELIEGQRKREVLLAVTKIPDVVGCSLAGDELLVFYDDNASMALRLEYREGEAE